MPFTKESVLILGAGASQAYGFPSGIGLRDKICEKLQNPLYPLVLEQYGFNADEANNFASDLKHSAYASVDAFLEASPGYLQIGRFLIALILLPYERSDRLFPPLVRAKDHWYEYLINRMDVGGPGWRKNKLTVLTFNYDRSFEHYFMTVIGQRTRARPSRVAELFQKINVVHLHGQLGPYPGLGNQPVPYGGGAAGGGFKEAAAGIRVISEAAHSLATFKAARAFLQGAERVYFLGFGFADISVQRLEVFTSPRFDTWSPLVVDGTSKGIPNRDWQRISRDLLGSRARAPRFRRSVAAFLQERANLS